MLISNNNHRLSRMGTQSRGGIKHFSGREIPSIVEVADAIDHIPANQLRDFGVWRPEDTVEAAKLLRQTGKLIVEGEAQVGKGTILYGISRMFDEAGYRYVFIDGHHQETPTQEVIRVINQAQDKRTGIFYDSFDYLFLGSRKIRHVSEARQQQRAAEIVAALSHTSVPLVATVHGPDWQRVFLNPDLITRHQDLLRSFATYRLSPYIDSPASIERFLIDHGIDRAMASAFLGLEGSRSFQAALTQTRGDKKYLAEVALAAREFAVLKKLVSEDKTLFIGLMRIMIDSQDSQSAVQLASLLLANSHEAVFLPILRGKRR